MTCTCKVFSTLLLDSRYFYSRGKKKRRKVFFFLSYAEKNCLYSSLACSVYSTCWFLSFKSHADIYSSFWHNSDDNNTLLVHTRFYSLLLKISLYIVLFFWYFFEFTRGDCNSQRLILWKCSFEGEFNELREMFIAKFYCLWLNHHCVQKKSLSLTNSKWLTCPVRSLHSSITLMLPWPV